MTGLYNPRPASPGSESAPDDATPHGPRLAVVLNPIKVESVKAFQELVTSLAHRTGWGKPSWHLTTADDPGASMADAAVAEGAELVLICGGDGTIRAVCERVAGTGIPVGIVPTGTGNLLARNLGIPLYAHTAIDVALTGQDKAIDLIEIGGDHLETTHFLVMAGMGLDAAIMEGVSETLKTRIGWLAYVVSGLRGLRFPEIRLEISVDDGPPTLHRARSVVVGNVGVLTGGMVLLPDARADDGLLDVVLLNPRHLWSWVPLAWRILGRRPQTDALVNRLRGTSITIRADRAIPREMDGDAPGAGRDLWMRCLHGQLLIRVPR